MLLTQIGEQAAKISSELKDKYATPEWNKITAFRNRAVHDYTGLDRFATFNIIKLDVPLLKTAISEIISAELDYGNFDQEEYKIAHTSIYLKRVDFSYIDMKRSQGKNQ